jgi:hypothetical protein
VHLEASKTKQCSKCKEVKLLNDFPRDRCKRDGLRASCKDCNKLRHKEYRQTNQDKVLEYFKEYRQNNREKRAQYQKEYRQKHSNEECQRLKIWRQNNPDKVRAGYARKRATKRNATPSWANKAAIAQIYAEALWLQDFTGEPCHVDHIVPLKSDFVCGLHVPANLQTLPGVENIAKSNRSWPGQLPCQTRRGIDHQWWKELYARTVALEE